MDPKLSETLRSIGFRPSLRSPDSLACLVEDVHVSAVEHPLWGLCLTYWQVGPRSAVAPTEMRVPVEASPQLLATCVLFCFKSVHPERFPGWSQYAEMNELAERFNDIVKSRPNA